MRTGSGEAFQPEDYVVTRIHADAEDGQKIPVTITNRKVRTRMPLTIVAL